MTSVNRARTSPSGRGHAAGQSSQAAHGSRFEPEQPDSSDDRGPGVSGAGAVLMVMAGQLSARDRLLRLSCVPRQPNEEADDLTNACFEGFGPARRVYVDPASIQWKVLGVGSQAVGGVLVVPGRLKLGKRARNQHSKGL